MTHDVKWIDGMREPVCDPDPDYPDGKDIDIAGTFCVEGWPACWVGLPYPAKRIGVYEVTCKTCGCTVIVTTAGRADDPRSVRMPCKKPAVVH